MTSNLQAYIDESEGELDYVMAGHIATEEAWAKFSREWEALLPFAKAKNGRHRFKMTEMVKFEDLRQHIPAFYRVIEDNVLVSISLRFAKEDLKRAQERAKEFMYSAFKFDAHIGYRFENPWFIAYRGLMDTFHLHRQEYDGFLPTGEKVDFIFDERTESENIREEWEDYLNRREQGVAEQYGAVPRFENDEEFLQLQAADLWAYQVREWYEWEDSPMPQQMKNFDFGGWKGKKRQLLPYYQNEDQLYEKFKAALIEHFADPNIPKRIMILPR